MLKFKKSLIIAVLFIVAFSTSGCVTLKTGGSKDVSGINGGVYKTANKATNWSQKVFIATPGSRQQTIAGLNVSTMIMDPSDSQTIYFGSVGNGLYYTYDGGNSWHIAKGLGKATIRTVAVDPNAKCIIYAGVGNKVFKSTDCSRSWKQVYQDNDPRITVDAIAIDQYDSKNIYIAVSRGDIIKSENAGEGWRTINRLNKKVKEIIIDPNDSRNLYVINSKGVLRLSDEGEAWDDLNKALKEFKLGTDIKDLTLVESDKNIIFIATNYGLIKSIDKGVTWEQIKLIPPEKKASINDFTVNPKNDQEIYYVTNTTFYRSIDSGVTWTPLKMPTARRGMKLLIDPKNPSIIYMGVWAPPKK